MEGNNLRSLFDVHSLSIPQVPEQSKICDVVPYSNWEVNLMCIKQYRDVCFFDKYNFLVLIIIFCTIIFLHVDFFSMFVLT